MPFPIPTDLLGPDSAKELPILFLVMTLSRAELPKAEALFFLLIPSDEIENLLLSIVVSFSSSSYSLIGNKKFFFPCLLNTLLEKKS